MTEYIEIRGARENNLKDVSLRIPKRKITIFTGVSGSGKSSIVFDTIATEAQRQLYENFSMFVRNFLPRYPQPEADAIENLSMAVIVDQKRLGGGSHSTVGTITDIYTAAAPAVLARRQAARRATRTRSRSTIRRACAPSATASAGRSASTSTTSSTCRSRSTRARSGPVLVDDWEHGAYAASGFFDNDKKLAEFTPEEMDLLLHGKDRKFKLQIGDKHDERDLLGRHREVRALVHHGATSRRCSERTQKAVEPYLTHAALPAVQGRAAEPGGAQLARSTATTSPSCRAMEVGELIAILAADQRSGRRADRRSARRAAAAPGRHRARLPEPRPRDRHAVRRRVAARQDGQAPRQQPGRRACTSSTSRASGCTRATCTG